MNDFRPAMHFVGFRHEWDAPDMRYQHAVRIFGPPDFIHRAWDVRAVADIAPGDVVVFATGDDSWRPCQHAYDDSHADIVAHGGPYDR